MTKAFEQAIVKASTLPDEEQDFLAAVLSGELDGLPTPAWHLKLLDEREAESVREGHLGIPLAEVMAELRARAK